MVGLGLPELVLVAIPVVLFLLALDDVVRRTFPDGSTKIVWALVILFVPLLGPILYLCVGKKQGERIPATSHRSPAPRNTSPGAAARRPTQDPTGGATDAGVRCPNCRATLSMGQPRCPKCGIAVRFCPTCRVPTIPTRPVCPTCGGRVRFSQSA